MGRPELWKVVRIGGGTGSQDTNPRHDNMVAVTVRPGAIERVESVWLEVSYGPDRGGGQDLRVEVEKLAVAKIEAFAAGYAKFSAGSM